MNGESISELRKLLALKAVAENGSFRAASRFLGITPSAVSQSIQALEKKLGKSLVIRERDGVRPTEEGLSILRKVAPAFEVLEELGEVCPRDFSIGRLDLGAYESLGLLIFPGIITQLRQDFPKAKLNLVTARSSILLHKLRTGELCTALVAETDEINEQRTKIVAEDELGLYVRAGGPYAHLGIKAVEKLGLGSLAPGPEGHPRYFQKFVKSFGLNDHPIMLTDSFEVLRSAAVNGALAAVLPKSIARNSTDLREITERPAGVKPEKGSHKIYLAYMDRCDEREGEYLVRLARKAYQGA